MKPKYNSRRKSTARKADQALQLAKKAFRSEELKEANYSLTAYAINSTGILLPIVQITRGTTNNEYIGNRILPTSVQWRFKLNQSVAAVSTQVRVMIVQWTSLIPATTAVTNVLATASLVSFKSDDFRYNSRVLYDKVYSLNTDRPETFTKGKLKLKDYMSFNETLNNPTRNGLYLLLLSDEAVNTPSLDFTSKVFYRDA